MADRRHRPSRFARLAGLGARLSLALLVVSHVQHAALHVLTHLHTEGTSIAHASETHHEPGHEDHVPHPASAHGVHAVPRTVSPLIDVGVLGPAVPAVYPPVERADEVFSGAAVRPTSESPPASIRLRAPPLG